MHSKLKSDGDKYGDIILYGRVSTAFLSVVYAASIEGSYVHYLSVILKFNRGFSNCYRRVLCISFALNTEIKEKRPISVKDVSTLCSCSARCSGEDCTHRDIISSVLDKVYSVLSIKALSYHSESNSDWRCLQITPHDSSQTIIWLNILNRKCSTSEIMFVPVVESRDKKHIYLNLRYRMRWIICRRSSRNRGLCAHEKCAIERAKTESDHCSGNTLRDDNCNVSDKSESDSDDNEFGNSIIKALEKQCYRASLPKRIVPCDSDFKAMTDFLLGVAGVVAKSREQEESDDPEKHISPMVVYDKLRRCLKCSFELSCTDNGRNCSVVKRCVKVHTLLQVTIEAAVLDLICPECKFINRFDGRNAAMFAWSVNVVFARDLIDFWLYHVAMLGGTFRAAFKFSRSISNTAAAAYSRLGSSSSCRRRLSNNYFRSF